jgi:endonuclease/exonuclease/phosphatase family metal-dependent hydrolase
VPGIVVASFNLHGGVDGWGRAYDAVAACAQLDADVLVLQENFARGGRHAGAPAGLAGEIAGALGYSVRTVHLAEARWYGEVADGRGFGPPPWVRRPVGLRVALARRTPRQEAGRRAWAAGERGSWGLALLSRLPLLRVEEIDLGQLRRDPAHRRALLAEVDAGGRRLAVAGVHMSHLSDGSVAHFRRLARALPPPGVEAVVAGDMNCWGPPLRLLLPGWRRAVRGRTWPAPRPLAQLDHLLVRPSMAVAGAAVVRLGASDHRAVRVVLGD